MQTMVTIGIPVYEAATYVRAALESALAQDYDDLEILVVDDCGRDGSMAVVEDLQRHHPRGRAIRVLHNEANQGAGRSRNRIIDEARGDYLYFLDSDDWIEPATITLLMEAMRQHDAQVVYGSYEKVDTLYHHPTQQYVYPPTLLLQPGELAVYAFSHYGRFQVSVCNCLFRLGFLRATGLRFVDAMFWEDMAFTCGLVTQVSRAVLLPDVTYHYICRANSLSNYQDEAVASRDMILANASTVDRLKVHCYRQRGEGYAPLYCVYLEMVSFYVVCHVLKHRRLIAPPISNRELRQMMRHPVRAADIMRFGSLRWYNLLLWCVSKLPATLCVAVVRLMGRLKHAL